MPIIKREHWFVHLKGDEPAPELIAKFEDILSKHAKTTWWVLLGYKNCYAVPQEAQPIWGIHPASRYPDDLLEALQAFFERREGYGLDFDDFQIWGSKPVTGWNITPTPPEITGRSTYAGAYDKALERMDEKGYTAAYLKFGCAQLETIHYSRMKKMCG